MIKDPSSITNPYKRMQKAVTICFRTNKDLKAALEKIARKDGRSLSSVIENMLYDGTKGWFDVNNERRVHPRKDVSFPALIYRRGAKESILETGIVNNVSLSGLKISLPQDYDIQNYMEFETVFSIPQEKAPVKLRCITNRVTDGDDAGKELAATFIDADLFSYQRLHRYLS